MDQDEPLPVASLWPRDADWESRLRRLASLRDDPDDLATLALAEIERLRAEVARLQRGE